SFTETTLIAFPLPVDADSCRKLRRFPERFTQTWMWVDARPNLPRRSFDEAGERGFRNQLARVVSNYVSTQEIARVCVVNHLREKKAADGVADGIDGRIRRPITIVHLHPAALDPYGGLVETQVINNGFASDSG